MARQDDEEEILLLRQSKILAHKNPMRFTKEFSFCGGGGNISNELAHGNNPESRAEEGEGEREKEKNVMDRSETTGRERI